VRTSLYEARIVAHAMQRHAGRRYVIAGTGSGAGRALALLAAQEGAHLVMGARSEARLRRTVELVHQAGDEGAKGHTVDLARGREAKAFLARAKKHLGGIDAVFCLAGGWFHGALHKQDESKIEEAYATFLKGALVVNQLAPGFLDRSRHPAIVNFGSATGTSVTVAGQTLYNTMKAAVTELTRSMAADLLADGIRVNAVLPGAISHRYHFGREYRSLRTLGHAVGTPEDVAHAALFLASMEASWITGSTLVVDGGFSVNRRTA